jgi:SAM-dependent methyltransferase
MPVIRLETLMPMTATPSAPFDAFARYYDADYRNYDADVDLILTLADESAGGPILELGCGTGRVLLPLADAQGHAVTGVDISPALLADCAQQTGRAAAWRRSVTCRGRHAHLNLPRRSFALPFAPATPSCT